MDWSSILMKTINLCQICGWGREWNRKKKEQVSVPIRRPTGETTEILLEKRKAADVGRIYGPSSVRSECY